MVGTNHNKVLTQWRHMPMCQFRANIFLIRITSNYFWASEVFKNQSFKSQIFSSSPKKNTPNWNHGLILMLLLFFINKIQNLYQFSEKESQKMGFKSCCQVYKSIFGLKYYQNFIIHLFHKQLTFKILIFENFWGPEVSWSKLYQRNIGAKLTHWHMPS